MALGEFDGNGNYQRLYNWLEHFQTGVGIEPDLHDNEDDAFANALSNCITRDGQSPATANIPLGGHKLVDVGEPTAPDDAATRSFIEQSNLYERKTALRMTGADANGRINFEYPSGVNGIGWNVCDMSLLGKAGVANQTPKRLVFNGKYDGSGADVVMIDQTGHMNVSWLQYNLVLEGSNWRNINIGQASLGVGLVSNGMQWWGQDAPATVAFQIASIRNFASVMNNAGTVTLNLIKAASTDQAIVRGYRGATIRWDLKLGDQVAESGAYKGSDFTLIRYDNGGDNPVLAMRIERENGNVTFGGDLEVPADKATRVGLGMMERAGWLGAYGTQHMNLWFQASGDTRVYADGTNVGQVPPPCDYRIKQDIEDLGSTWDKVRKLRPVAYRYIADYGGAKHDPRERWGFIAHELQGALLETAATGKKDMEGGFQSPDPWALIAALTSALQEAMTRIERLEGKAA